MATRIQHVQHQGIVGELHLPGQAATHRAAALVVAGSSGGLRHRELAGRLAEAGIPALALAYFAYGSLPAQLHRIPLEYFFRAIEYLRTHPELRDAALVAMGSSRGAELVLQLATMHPGVAGVIATSPSHVRWGATGQPGPAWIFEGAPLPFVQPIADGEELTQTEEVEGRSYAIYQHWYTAQLEGNPSVPAATIPVERANGPILLFSGAGDQLWPSTLFANQIEARARAHGFAHPLLNVQYHTGGHIFPLPGQPPVLHASHPALDSGIAYGGTGEGVASATLDRWERVL